MTSVHVSAEKLGKSRSEEHTSELQSLRHLVCRLLLEKKKSLFEYFFVVHAMSEPTESRASYTVGISVRGKPGRSHTRENGEGDISITVCHIFAKLTSR